MKIFYSLFIIVCFIGCVNSQKEEDDVRNKDSYLSKVGEVVVSLDNLSTYEFYNAALIHDGSKEFLYNLNYINYSIDVYDASIGKIIKRIPIHKGGPTGINMLQGFTVVNKDSIFIFERFKLDGSILIDGEGNFKNKIRAQTVDTELQGLLNHLSDISNKSYFINNKLYFSRYLLGKDSNGFMNFTGEGHFNINTGKIEFVKSIHPPEIYGKIPSLQSEGSYSRIKIDEYNWLMSWHYSDSIENYIQTDTAMTITRYYASVKDYIQYEPSISLANEYDNRKLKFESHLFGAIYYHDKSRTYHRIVYLPLEFNPSDHIKENPFLLKNFSILSFDEYFNIIGVSHFKSKVYDPRLIIVGEKGLYIPRSNPKNKSLNEDELVYDIYSN
jgi:hypothetical protein